GQDLSLGFLLQQLGESLSRIAGNLQTFLFGAAFRTFALRFGGFLHFVLHFRDRFPISQVLRSGIEPERPWARTRECKSRLSTSSSIGAQSQDVAAEGPSKSSSAATRFGPSRAAHGWVWRLFSFLFLLQKHCWRTHHRDCSGLDLKLDIRWHG